MNHNHRYGSQNEATVLHVTPCNVVSFKLQIVTDKGSHLDIRLPSITSSLTAAGEYRSPSRGRRQNTVLTGASPDSGKFLTASAILNLQYSCTKHAKYPTAVITVKGPVFLLCCRKVLIPNHGPQTTRTATITHGSQFLQGQCPNQANTASFHILNNSLSIPAGEINFFAPKIFREALRPIRASY